MSIYFTKMGIIMESQARTENQDAVAASTQIMSRSNDYSTNGRVYVCSLLCEVSIPACLWSPQGCQKDFGL